MVRQDTHDHTAAGETKVPLSGLGSSTIRTVLAGAAGANTIAWGLTVYIPMVGEGPPSTTRSDVHTIMPIAGTLKTFYVAIQDNTLDGDAVFRIYNSSTGTSMTLTFSAGQTGNQVNGSDTATIAAGSNLSVRIDTTDASTGSIRGISAGVILEAE